MATLFTSGLNSPTFSYFQSSGAPTAVVSQPIQQVSDYVSPFSPGQTVYQSFQILKTIIQLLEAAASNQAGAPSTTTFAVPTISLQQYAYTVQNIIDKQLETLHADQDWSLNTSETPGWSASAALGQIEGSFNPGLTSPSGSATSVYAHQLTRLAYLYILGLNKDLNGFSTGSFPQYSVDPSVENVIPSTYYSGSNIQNQINRYTLYFLWNSGVMATSVVDSTSYPVNELILQLENYLRSALISFETPSNLGSWNYFISSDTYSTDYGITLSVTPGYLFATILNNTYDSINLLISGLPNIFVNPNITSTNNTTVTLTAVFYLAGIAYNALNLSATTLKQAPEKPLIGGVGYYQAAAAALMDAVDSFLPALQASIGQFSVATAGVYPFNAQVIAEISSYTNVPARGTPDIQRVPGSAVPNIINLYGLFNTLSNIIYQIEATPDPYGLTGDAVSGTVSYLTGMNTSIVTVVIPKLQTALTSIRNNFGTSSIDNNTYSPWGIPFLKWSQKYGPITGANTK